MHGLHFPAKTGVHWSRTVLDVEKRHAANHHQTAHRVRQLSEHRQAQERRAQGRWRRARVRGDQAGQPRLQADGTGSEVRRQRNGDRHLPAGARLQQADRAVAGGDVSAASSTTRSSTAPSAARSGVQDLPGKRLAVRSYTQTTGVWIRGIVENDYGVDLNKASWTVQEGAHVTEYKDPPELNRVSMEHDLLKMLLAREIDAVIYGADLPDDPRLKTVIENPKEEARNGSQARSGADQSHGGGEEIAGRAAARGGAKRSTTCCARAKPRPCRRRIRSKRHHSASKRRGRRSS